jgi:PhnB protein
MSTAKIPNGHQAIMPYLMLKSSAIFIKFTKNVFGAEVTFTRMRENTDIVMHSEIQINGSTIMFCDSTDSWKVHTSNLFIYVDDADETYKRALSEDAISLMEPADQDYGRSCGVTDPCGNVWWITSVK